jgi:hypothetical protein
VTIVIARLDRAIQYARRHAIAKVSGYWIARMRGQ